MQKLVTIILTLSTVCSFAQKGQKESVQFEKPPVIDGNVDDWPSEWWLDPDGKFLSNVGNDADNLYFRLKISDDVTQQKIGLFGLSVKLDPKGKRKCKVGLKYPVGRDASEIKKEDPKAVDPAATELSAKVAMKKGWVSDVEVVELIGLAKQNIVSSRLGLANGIESIIVAQDDGTYIYEAKIPFKAFAIKKADTPVIGVEFETGRYIQANKNQSANTGYSPNSQMMSRPGYGQQQQMPRSYYSSYQYNALASPGYLWYAVKLK